MQWLCQFREQLEEAQKQQSVKRWIRCSGIASIFAYLRTSYDKPGHTH